MGLNITLINPPILTYNSPFRLQPTPPLGLALIAGVLDQNGHQVNIIDCVAESPDKRVSFKGKIDKIGLLDEDIFAKIPSNTDLVGISCMFSDNWLHTRLLIDEIATTRTTERGGRADDKRAETAMEDRKKQGYF